MPASLNCGYFICNVHTLEFCGRLTYLGTIRIAKKKKESTQKTKHGQKKIRNVKNVTKVFREVV